MPLPASIQPGRSLPRVPGGARAAYGPKLWLAAVVACVVGVLLIMVLPLYVPAKPIQTVSASYLAGFNNSVAIAAAALLSVAVLLLSLWVWRGTTREGDASWAGPRMSRGFVASVVTVSAVVLGICGWLVAASHMRYLGDAGYIIEQATVRRDTGRALYAQLEFAYGPLLLMPEVWLSELLHCSMTFAYFVTLVVESSLGLMMLAYVLNELPIRTRLRQVALVLFALGAITPHLGLNYTYFRFVSPFAVLLFATRRRSLWASVVLLSAGEVVELLISPELGLALAVGVGVYGVLRAWQAGPRWLAVAAVPVATVGLLLATLGRPYLRMAAMFSKGALNLPVGPYPHVLVFLFAAIWLVPSMLGRWFGPHESGSSHVLAVYAMGLAFLPAALGRCDPLHVMFDGIGMLVLSLVAISASSARMRNVWIVCLAVLVVWNHYVNDRLAARRTGEVLQQTLMPHTPASLKGALVKVLSLHRPDVAAELASPPKPDVQLDTPAWRELTGHQKVATPFEVSPAVEAELSRRGQFDPSYYAFGVDVLNPAAEQRTITEVNADKWLLLPADLVVENVHTPQELAVMQGYRVPYRTRHAMPYMPRAAFAENLREHWMAVQQVGPYMLYSHK